MTTTANDSADTSPQSPDHKTTTTTTVDASDVATTAAASSSSSNHKVATVTVTPATSRKRPHDWPSPATEHAAGALSELAEPTPNGVHDLPPSTAAAASSASSSAAAATAVDSAKDDAGPILKKHKLIEPGTRIEGCSEEATKVLTETQPAFVRLVEVYHKAQLAVMNGFDFDTMSMSGSAANATETPKKKPAKKQKRSKSAVAAAAEPASSSSSAAAATTVAETATKKKKKKSQRRSITDEDVQNGTDAAWASEEDADVDVDATDSDDDDGDEEEEEKKQSKDKKKKSKKSPIKAEDTIPETFKRMVIPSMVEAEPPETGTVDGSAAGERKLSRVARTALAASKLDATKLKGELRQLLLVSKDTREEDDGSIKPFERDRPWIRQGAVPSVAVIGASRNEVVDIRYPVKYAYKPGKYVSINSVAAARPHLLIDWAKVRFTAISDLQWLKGKFKFLILKPQTLGSLSAIAVANFAFLLEEGGSLLTQISKGAEPSAAECQRIIDANPAMGIAATETRDSNDGTVRTYQLYRRS